MFVTISGGYWHSNDLLHWNYIEPSRWPMEDICAPAALSVRDTLYLFQSTFSTRPIFYSTKPETGKLEFFNRLLPLLPDTLGPWDPDIFYDKDLDKWYMYFGSSNVHPLYGVELNHEKGLSYKKRPEGLISLHPDVHGWERFGRNHTDPRHPFIEGAWMTKYDGKYYLQYAAPGTEYNVYGNGTYIGDHPLGHLNTLRIIQFHISLADLWPVPDMEILLKISMEIIGIPELHGLLLIGILKEEFLCFRLVLIKMISCMLIQDLEISRITFLIKN